MRDPWDESELARRFRETSASMEPRAPLYAALASGIARDRALHGLLFHAPPEQRLPVLLFAAVHDLLLADPSHPLAQWYPNLTDNHRSPSDSALLATFAAFVDDHAPTIMATLSSRSVQTNEVGRTGLLLPALGLAASEFGELALLDVGTSAGLTLLLDRYHFTYWAHGDKVADIGPASSVQIDVDVRGTGPIAETIPTIATRCGIDLAPIDVTDPSAARWLEACVWPDQAARFKRLRSALAIAAEAPPEILAGDAVASVVPALERLARRGHPTVTNSWALNYLPVEQQRAYVTELDRFGSDHDVSWIFAESPALTPGLPWETELDDPHLTVLSMATWRNGERTQRHLASAHPHGYWLHWMPGAAN
ncbi:MAG: hypothetical protein ACI9CV_001977 [Ilumatobacter sp.]|jgi:hypothetical protein